MIRREPAQRLIGQVPAIVRMALETMLKYERSQGRLRLRADRPETFFYLLTHAGERDPGGSRVLPEDLGFLEKPVRIPLPLICKSGAARLSARPRYLLGRGGAPADSFLSPHRREGKAPADGEGACLWLHRAPAAPFKRGLCGNPQKYLQGVRPGLPPGPSSSTGTGWSTAARP